ncbi:methyltransferase domain-containing protein [Tsukamurella sp. 8F]|uniref:class I SAM-dependent methyltransferase n=1 Tax=unclassified Tsukamurella TaxID=2633480 RepID=UPI0023B9166B|nr:MULTISPECIES: class I SAM-dependent methyltransferase [unclassified Tsukamurella]MDF0528355.1 methyltransferase domain-containing protein [Tsukamurella sp. 8J]MDF0586180.1 methyltransferase domain-containing protein [Tsukamurella sp. 8F]
MHEHDIDWAGMAERLITEGEALLPFVTGAAASLAERIAPRRIMDIGAGPGVAACALAQRFPDAEVIAVDGSEQLLERAAERARSMGMRLTTRVAEFPDGFADLPEADLIWTSHVLHHVGDQAAAVRALAGKLHPGGILAIAEGGLTTRFLPRDTGLGRPGLEARIEAAATEWFSRMRAGLPHAADVVEDWPTMLAASGLVEAGSRSYLIDRPAPLHDGFRAFVRSQFVRAAETLAEDLDAEDLATLTTLAGDGQDSIAHRSDVYILAARTVHSAARPQPR